MRADHLSDMELQQWVLDPTNCGAEQLAHLGQCEKCMIKAGEYRLLITQIRQEPAPVFDFDLKEVVLSQLRGYERQLEPGYEQVLPSDGSHEPIRTRGSGPMGIVWLVVFLVPGALLYLFGKEVRGLFSGFSGMMLWLLGTSAAIILLFQSIELYKKYQRKIDALNLY